MVQAWEGHESFSQAADDVARKLLEACALPGSSRHHGTFVWAA
eukprot:CAMPEP_0204162328 /NCGR_PEP_ID=MMETSP0361-20130328/35468_1 /ASSEMBLY_ACC=CAM_ASM_000343 /TAXON_ID=268821 /ORGANISM="Scrippsiella Hangoei, Strain SHTV-5" /LENGTH=42 /DNA_ID= /DNA_START= /DNA_END= /DNA_ORIENTATION=